MLSSGSLKMGLSRCVGVTHNLYREAKKKSLDYKRKDLTSVEV